MFLSNMTPYFMPFKIICDVAPLEVRGGNAIKDNYFAY